MPPPPECATRLVAALDAAEPLLRAMTDAESARAPASGKWSPRQIIGHLIDSATNNHQRFVRGALQDELVFPGYAQEAWVALQQYQEAQWSELLTLWAAYNRRISAVMTAIPPEARRRVRAKHNLDLIAMRAPANEAEATLEYLMNDYVDHLEKHMQQILGDAWRSGSSSRASG
jgi:DinB superfamily